MIARAGTSRGPTAKHGGTRPGSGRPATRGAARGERIDIRATEADKAELTAAAATAGVSLGEYLIVSGLERARSQR